MQVWRVNNDVYDLKRGLRVKIIKRILWCNGFEPLSPGTVRFNELNTPSFKVARCVDHYSSTTFIVVKGWWHKADETETLPPFWPEIAGRRGKTQERKQNKPDMTA